MDAGYYPVTRVDPLEIQGCHFLLVEASVSKRLQHKRVIGNDPGKPMYGRPVWYCDSYGDPDDPTIYVYARHRATADQFLKLLGTFVTQASAEFKELKGREFPVWLNVGGLPLETNIREPFAIEDQITRDFLFLRMSLPFGDVAVEFAAVKDSEEFEALGRKTLPVVREAPLVGCDLTKGPMLKWLLARLHWAAEQLPIQVLEEILEKFSRTSVPA